MGQLELDSKRRKRVKYCPCNKSNGDGKFVPYIEHEKYGYCHSCDKTFYPESGTIVENLPPPIELPTFRYDPVLVSKSCSTSKRNNFISYLNTRFSSIEVKEAALRYLIGTSGYWEGATVFWQIDNNGNARHGKVMLYDPDTGRRSKNHFNTVKTILKLKQDGQKLRQCLFGLHLINETDNRKIAIVESEKTAVVMSIIFKDYLWMATGGKGGLKYDMIKPIRSYRVIAFPDRDGVEQWTSDAEKLGKYGFKIKVDGLLMDMDVSDNADIADIFLTKSPVIKYDPTFDPEEFENGQSPVDRGGAFFKTHKARIDTLENFFKNLNTQTLGTPCMVGPGEVINNPRRTIETHLKVLRATKTAKGAMPYLNRLERLRDNVI